MKSASIKSADCYATGDFKSVVMNPFDAVLAKTATTPTRSPKIDESSSLSSKKCLSPMSRDIGS